MVLILFLALSLAQAVVAVVAKHLVEMVDQVAVIQTALEAPALELQTKAGAGEHQHHQLVVGVVVVQVPLE